MYDEKNKISVQGYTYVRRWVQRSKYILGIIIFGGKLPMCQKSKNSNKLWYTVENCQSQMIGKEAEASRHRKSPNY